MENYDKEDYELRVVCIASNHPYKNITKPTVIECVNKLTLGTVGAVPKLSSIAGTLSDGIWINSKTYHGDVKLKGPKSDILLEYLKEHDHSPLTGVIHNGTYRIFAVLGEKE